MFMFLDVETTGKPTRRNATYREVDVWPRIVSISWAFHLPSGDLVHQRHAVMKPDGFVIPAEATHIHGITTAYAQRHGRRLHDVLMEVNTELESARPALLIAHNIEFDRNVLLAEMLRANADLHLDRIPTSCTMLTGTDVCRLPGWGGRYKWPTLEELHRFLFGTAFDGAHDAAADVQACVRCYFELRRQAEAGGESSGKYAGSGPDGLIEKILCWAEDNDRFDTTFVLDLQEKLEEYGRLTERQIEALENIIARWRIE